MAKHLESGKYGEQLATRYLEGQGYSILFVNWRYKRWEIDIVAKERDVLVFVEVKSRSMTSFGEPVDFVDQKKRQHLQADHMIRLLMRSSKSLRCTRLLRTSWVTRIWKLQ